MSYMPAGTKWHYIYDDNLMIPPSANNHLHPFVQSSKPETPGTSTTSESEDCLVTMSEPKESESEKADLTTLLTEDSRNDLVLLIADITASMRKLIVDNFDPVAGLILEIKRHPKKLSADDRMKREKELKNQYDTEVAKPTTRALKKEALNAFDSWRRDVVQRVAQAVQQEATGKESAEDKSKKGSTNLTPAATPTDDGTLKFKELFPPTKTPLTKLKMNERTLILHSVLLLLLSLEHYIAPSRILLLYLTSSLKLPLKTFEQDEYTTAKGLLEAAKEMTADEETKKKIEETKDKRLWKVGLATAAGAAIIGVTGGMAAPLVAAGVASVMGGLGLGASAAAGYLGSVAASTLLVGSIFGAFGGRMTGSMMNEYAKEVDDFAFIPVHSNQKTSEDQTEGAKSASDHDHKLRVTICISGWLTEKEDVVAPWNVIGSGAEVFGMRYEQEALLNLGHGMEGLVQSATWGSAQKEDVMPSMLAEYTSAIWPVGLMKVAKVIDTPFGVAKSRADKAGEVLADALINKAQGERPVTLIGYSLGARVIYSCLQTLAKRKAFGLIENCILLGAPTPSSTSEWRTLRSVVSGRLINVYSGKDKVLGFMYRTSGIQDGVAGMQKVEGLPGVENIDVSDDIKSHLQYRYQIGNILTKIGFKDIEPQAVENQRAAMKESEQQEKQKSQKSKRIQLERRQSKGGKGDEAAEAEIEANELQKQVAANTQKSLKARIIEWWMTPNVPSVEDVGKLADNATGNAQKVVQDPTKAGAIAGDTIEDVQSSTESYAQWALRKLPSMPGTKKTSVAGLQKTALNPGNATKDVSKLASDPTKVGEATTGALNDVQASTESYTAWAAKKLNLAGGSKNPTGDVQKSVPDVSKAIENVPQAASDAVAGLQKVAGDPTEAAGDATASLQKAAGDPTKAAGDAAAGLQKVTGDPTKAVGDLSKNLQPATDPSKVVGNASKVGNDAAKAAKSYTNYLPSLPSTPFSGRKKSTQAGEQKSKVDPSNTPSSVAKDAVKVPDEAANQAKAAADIVTSKATGAASYLPNLPSSPFSGRKKTTPAGQAKPKTDAPSTPSNLANDPSKIASEATNQASTIADTATSGVTSAASYFPSLPSSPFSGRKRSKPAANEKPKVETPDSPSKVAKDASKLPDQGANQAKAATDIAKSSIIDASNTATEGFSQLTSSKSATKPPLTPRKSTGVQSPNAVADTAKSTLTDTANMATKGLSQLTPSKSAAKPPITPRKSSGGKNSPAAPAETAKSTVTDATSSVTTSLPSLAPTKSGAGKPALTPRKSSGVKSPAAVAETAKSTATEAADTVTKSLSSLNPIKSGTGKPLLTPRKSSGVKSPVTVSDTAKSSVTSAASTVTNSLPSSTPTKSGTGKPVLTPKKSSSAVKSPPVVKSPPRSVADSTKSSVADTASRVTKPIPTLTPTKPETKSPTPTPRKSSGVKVAPAAVANSAKSGVTSAASTVTNSLPSLTPKKPGTSKPSPATPKKSPSSGAKMPPAKSSKPRTPVQIHQAKTPVQKATSSAKSLPATGANTVKKTPKAVTDGAKKASSGIVSVGSGATKQGAKVGTNATNAGAGAVDQVGKAGTGLVNAGSGVAKGGGKGLGKLGGLIGFRRKK